MGQQLTVQMVLIAGKTRTPAREKSRRLAKQFSPELGSVSEQEEDGGRVAALSPAGSLETLERQARIELAGKGERGGEARTDIEGMRGGGVGTQYVKEGGGGGNAQTKKGGVKKHCV
jgi:hypothetical protein